MFQSKDHQNIYNEPYSRSIYSISKFKEEQKNSSEVTNLGINLDLFQKTEESNKWRAEGEFLHVYHFF